MIVAGSKEAALASWEEWAENVEGRIMEVAEGLGTGLWGREWAGTPTSFLSNREDGDALGAGNCKRQI